MNPVFEDDFWEVDINWSKPVSYKSARDNGSDHDKTANLYMITIRYADHDHKPVYIGKTYRQNIQTRLKQKDHQVRYAAIIKNHPKHQVYVRYGTVTVQGGNVTEKRIKDIESVLIYCYENDHSQNIKSIYTHGVTDSYQIISSGHRSELPKCLAFGFFSRG